MSQQASYDVIIVGGGHNGLVCACYLAGAGLRVRVLEKRGIVGGAAVTEEFHPGFRNSTLSYTVSLLQAKVIADLRLAEHGLRVVERPLPNFLPFFDGSCLRMPADAASLRAEIARYSARDAARVADYLALVARMADALRSLILTTPPNLGGGWRAALGALVLGRNLSKLGIEGQRDLWEFLTRSAGDLLDDWFESDQVKAAFGFDSIVGNFAGPYSPGSAYVLLHHAFGEVNGKRGSWGHSIGGMGAISTALAAEARRRGVDIDTDAAVAEVRVGAGRIAGVVLEDGRSFEARNVASGINPRLLYGKLLPAAALPEGFAARMARWKCASGVMRMNVALSKLPDFSSAPGSHQQAHHGAGIIVAPSLAYMERGFHDARSLGWSREPVVEVLIPSTLDDSLAPKGLHVASLFCQYFSPDLPQGQSWDAVRDAAADAAIAVVNRVAPNFGASIIARQIHTPLDLERTFGLVGGDIFHGALSLDQLFSARPLLGHSDYRGPIKGLYHCGSGAHPGGGVTGAPGYNAAREMIRDLK
jgi:phytoene dehydrogenase-like protein